MKPQKIKIKCPHCSQEKDWQWVEVASSHSRLIRFCCEQAEEDKRFQRVGLGIKTKRDAVAFMVDKETGREMAVDKKGNKFDPSDTIYADQHRGDKYGWKATGKVKAKKTYHFMKG